MADLAAAVWFERLQRRADLADAEWRKLVHDLLRASASMELEAATSAEQRDRLRRVLERMGKWAGIGPPPAGVPAELGQQVGG